MNMYPSVKEVRPQEDYTLSIVFENGEKGTLDMKPILNFGVFQRLNKYEIFRQVRVSFDTVEWECGVDLDPEFIYKKCIAQTTV
jgi:hypothetical protein